MGSGVWQEREWALALPIALPHVPAQGDGMDPRSAVDACATVPYCSTVPQERVGQRLHVRRPARCCAAPPWPPSMFS